MYNIKTLINTLKEETDKEKKEEEYIYLETLRKNLRVLFGKIDNQLDKAIKQETYEYAEKKQAIYIEVEDTKNFLDNYTLSTPLETYLGYTKYSLYRIKSKPYYTEFLFEVFNHPYKVTHIQIFKTEFKSKLMVYIK